MSDPQVSTFEMGSTVINLAGGLALFLFGLEQMSESLRTIAGERMKSLLGKATGNRFTAATTGAVVTAVIQSSSATTVLVVGFISAGLLTLTQAIPLIMGANIGTTITAQVIAFKVTKFSLVFIVFGYGMIFFGKQQRTIGYGKIIMGIGLIFFGMQLMGDATEPLRSYSPFIEMMKSMNNSLLAALVGMVFTALIQSSSATTGVVIMLASQGFITLEAGIAMALGANVGTCVTALLASIGKSREAIQGAMVHVVFNLTGVLIWIGLIDQLAEVSRLLSPEAETLTGKDKLAAEVPRQIANAHTIFNIFNTILFIGFTTQMGRVVKRLVPEKPVFVEEEIEPKYLDDNLIPTPDLALDRVRLEIERMGKYVIYMVGKVPRVVLHGTPEEVHQLKELDHDVDLLHGYIVHYLGRLSIESIDENQSELLHDYLAATNYIENIGDMVETNLVELGEERIYKRVHVSKSTEGRLIELYDRVLDNIKNAIDALTENDCELAGKVIGQKEEIDRLVRQTETHLARRLIAEEPNRLESFRVESDLIENLKRMYYFAKRIAKLVRSDDVINEDEKDRLGVT